MQPSNKNSEFARKARISSTTSPARSDHLKVWGDRDFDDKSKARTAFRSTSQIGKRPIFEVRVESRGSILSTFRNRPLEMLDDFAPRATRSGKYLHREKNSRVESAKAFPVTTRSRFRPSESSFWSLVLLVIGHSKHAT